MLIPAESVLVLMTSNDATPTQHTFEPVSQRLLSAANFAGVPVIRSIYSARYGRHLSVDAADEDHTPMVQKLRKANDARPLAPTSLRFGPAAHDRVRARAAVQQRVQIGGAFAEIESQWPTFGAN